jgi:hypothetical protein
VFTIGTYVAKKLECGGSSGGDGESSSNGQLIINPVAGAPTQRPLLVE